MVEPPKKGIMRLPAMVGRGAAKKLYHTGRGDWGLGIRFQDSGFMGVEYCLTLRFRCFARIEVVGEKHWMIHNRSGCNLGYPMLRPYGFGGSRTTPYRR
jgi:hypothetical protein